MRTALENAGWVVTHDPFRIPKGVIGAKLEIDLGLEKIIIAEKETERIAVEVKSFLKISYRFGASSLFFAMVRF